MSILLCSEMEERFSSYLDGTLTGVAMVEMQEHLEHCGECAQSFAAWRATLNALATLTRVRAPRTLSLQLRIALSHERARTPRSAWEHLCVQWQNTIAPLAVRASAGLASAVLLLGGLLLLVGTFASPEAARAGDEPIGTASQPRLLYVAHPDGSDPLAALNGSVVVRVFVNEQGEVYDYRILSGPENERARSALANGMMWSVFEPAQVFGEPVPGSVILSLAGVSVPG